MRNLLAFAIVAVVAAVSLVGCGDEPTSTTELNPYFKLKTGDTFTYARYERDMNNQRVEASKTMHKWVVIQTGLTFNGKVDVSRILQINYDANMASEVAPRDTLYIRSAIDGEIAIYDVVGVVMGRIPMAADFADSIQPRWYKVSDIKIANAQVWDPIFGVTQLNATATVGGIPVNATITAKAYHKGKLATTVLGRAYPNAFHTDHTIKSIAKVAGALTVLDDSLRISYDVDLNDGILRQVMPSDSVSAGLDGTLVPTPIPGFEMELVSAVRAK